MAKPVPELRPLTHDTLTALLSPGEGPLVSLAIPTHRAFPAADQNVVRLRQAAKRAAERLEAAGVSADEAAQRRERIEAIAEKTSALEHPLDGLVVFQDRTSTQAYVIADAVPERVVVGARYELRPLLRALHAEHRYLVFAVSEKRVALLEGDARGVSPAPLDGIPASLVDALGSEVTEKQTRTRIVTPSPGYASHGGDSARDESKRDLERFYAALAQALERRLRGEASPLVLAADVPHVAALRARLRLPGLVEEALHGNPDHLGAAELHARAWPLVRRAMDARNAALASAFETARNHGKSAVTLEDVAAAALAGRVRRLWIDTTARIPGRLDASLGRVVEDPASDGDALDETAEQVIRTGGDVLLVEAAHMPAPGPVAAELR